MYGLVRKRAPVTPSAATPLATCLVFSTPSSVKYRSGSGGHFGSSRSMAIPCRTMYSCMFPSQLGVGISPAQNHERSPWPALYDFQPLTLNLILSTWWRLAEIESHMKFLFKELRAAIRISEVFRGISARVHLQANRASLERSANFYYPLPVRVVERLGNSQNRGKPPGDGFVRIFQGRVCGVMSPGH